MKDELEMLREDWIRRDRLRPDPEGRYAWDCWETRALSAGVAPEVAALGREIMKLAVQLSWAGPLQAECGWDDQGRAMLAWAVQDGPEAARYWQQLIELARS